MSAPDLTRGTLGAWALAIRRDRKALVGASLLALFAVVTTTLSSASLNFTTLLLVVRVPSGEDRQPFSRASRMSPRCSNA